MSNLKVRLHRLWVDWCEHHKPTEDETPWPAEAFLAWAARELCTELIAVLGNEKQTTLLHRLAPHVQERWPAPPPEREHPTDPTHDKPSWHPPGPQPPTLVPIDGPRTDLWNHGKLGSNGTLELGYHPTTTVHITWLEAKFATTVEHYLDAVQAISCTSITIGGEEMLVSPCPFHLLCGRQNEGLFRMPGARAGTPIAFKLKNESKHNIEVELRLCGLEVAKKVETT